MSQTKTQCPKSYAFNLTVRQFRGDHITAEEAVEEAFSSTSTVRLPEALLHRIHNTITDKTESALGRAEAAAH